MRIRGDKIDLKNGFDINEKRQVKLLLRKKKYVEEQGEQQEVNSVLET